MSPDPASPYNDVARMLIGAVLRDHPDWERHMRVCGPDDDPEAVPGSVRFSVPAPRQPAHRLELAQRGNTIEMAYDCGGRAGRAEIQFIFGASDVGEAVSEVRTFLSWFCANDIVVVMEPAGTAVRAAYGSEVSQLAFFRAAADVASARRGAFRAIHVWSGAAPEQGSTYPDA
jgi:hypothetical protein